MISYHGRGILGKVATAPDPTGWDIKRVKCSTAKLELMSDRNTTVTLSDSRNEQYSRQRVKLRMCRRASPRSLLPPGDGGPCSATSTSTWPCVWSSPADGPTSPGRAGCCRTDIINVCRSEPQHRPIPLVRLAKLSRRVSAAVVVIVKCPSPVQRRRQLSRCCAPPSCRNRCPATESVTCCYFLPFHDVSAKFIRVCAQFAMWCWRFDDRWWSLQQHQHWSTPCQHHHHCKPASSLVLS